MTDQTNGRQSTLKTTLSRIDGPLFVMQPNEGHLRTVNEIVDGKDGPDEVSFFAPKNIYEDAANDFHTAERLSRLVQTGANTCYIDYATPEDCYIYTSETAYKVGDGEDEISERAIEDTPHTQSDPQCRVKLRVYTPSFPTNSEMEAKFEDSLSRPIYKRFQEVLTTLRPLQIKYSKQPLVALILLCAAEANLLVADVVDVCTCLELSSASTISRTKTSLEDKGYIETTKEPSGPGHPDLRLHLTSPDDVSLEDIIRDVYPKYT